MSFKIKKKLKCSVKKQTHHETLSSLTRYYLCALNLILWFVVFQIALAKVVLGSDVAGELIDVVNVNLSLQRSANCSCVVGKKKRALCQSLVGAQQHGCFISCRGSIVLFGEY